MRKTTAWPLSLLVLAASACATAAPSTVPPPSDEIGPPVSSYSVPAEAPRGMVHVMSLGRETLPVATGQPRVYLHLRLAAVNGSDDQTWTLDPREQLLADGDRTWAPAFCDSSTGAPVVQLGRASRGFLDLYYPMLTSQGKRPPQVSLSWRLRRGPQMFAQATEFERSPERADGYVYYQPADQAHLFASRGSESWWWSDYYFWHDDARWWPVRQSDFSRRYPHHRQEWQAERERQRAQSQGDLATSSRADSSDYWRGIKREGSSDFTPDGTSSWRGSPPAQTVSSSPVTDSSTGSSGSSSGNNGGGAGDGKSSWRGGSGP
jgi:hypothetical protein